MIILTLTPEQYETIVLAVQNMAYDDFNTMFKCRQVLEYLGEPLDKPEVGKVYEEAHGEG